MAPPASTAPQVLGTDGIATGHRSPESGSSQRPAAQIVAITTRDDFLLELGEALSGHASITPVESLAAALESLSDKRLPQLLVIDARGIADLRADVDHATTQVPHAAVLVFTEADAQQQIAATVKGSGAFAVLTVPANTAKTVAVFEGAIAEARDRLTSAAATPPPVTHLTSGAAPAHDSATPDIGSATIATGGAALPEAVSPQTDSPGASGGTIRVAASLAAALLASGAAWLFFNRTDSGSSTQPPAETPLESAQDTAANDDLVISAPSAETTLLQGSIDELLEKARFAMRERRYTEPTGDNALLYYRSVAAIDGNNPEALDGLARVAALLATRFEEAMAEAHYDEAAQSLAHLKSASPGDERLREFDVRLAHGQVNKALTDGNTDRAAALVRLAQQSGTVPADQIARWRAEISRKQDDARVQRLVSAAGDRIREDRLIAPQNDSAKYYVNQLREIAPTSADAQRASRNLIAAYLRKAREAALSNRQNDAERWLAEANAAGVSAADIAAYHRELANVHQRAAAAEADRLAQLVRDRMREGRLTEPAQDSASDHLAALEAANRNHAALPAISRELVTRLLERAGAAAREGRSAQMEADLTQARRWGADARSIQAVRQQIVAATGKPAAPSAVDAEALQDRLNRVRHVMPEYPFRALSDGIAGEVVVAFTVGKNGETRNVRVESANPEGIFDRSAIAAVSRWRYAPVVVDGAPVEVPTRALIRYAPPD